jgi:crotonobetainyl-CoA:carnitine CoA-transferase CaiB-like acyl-CoA transferase
MASELLAGMRVLDFSIWRPAPYATQLLADLGAEVLKVEPPGGDPMRAFADIFTTVASHKRSIVLDLKSDDGHARALELAADADVVVEGWRPGVAARLRVGPDDIRAVNPEVIYCSLSGFGQTGPRALEPGHDVNYQAVSGVLAPVTGEPARQSPDIPWADLAGGLAAAFAICAAWAGKLRSGEGETIDVAMTDLLATWTGAVGGGSLAGVRARVAGLPAYGAFTAADGVLVLGTITEPHFWDATCTALGLDDLCGLSVPEQIERGEELRARFAAALAPLPRDAAVARLLAAGAPASPVLTRDEMLADEHLIARGVVVPRDGALPWLSHPVTYERHQPRSASGPPAPGEHTGFARPDGV